MATYTATNASSVVPARFVHSGLFSVTGGPFSSSVLTVTDIVQMMKVPNGFRTKEMLIKASSLPLSAGGNVATILQVGDGTVAGRFMSVSVSATAYFRLGAGVATDVFYEFTVTDTIDVTVGASSLTDSASKSVTLTLIAMGSIDD